MTKAIAILFLLFLSQNVTAAPNVAPDQEKAKKWASEVLPLVEKVKIENRFERSKRLWDINIGLKDVGHKYFLLDSPIIKKEEDSYGPVRFTHFQHSTWMRNCNVCHHVKPAKPGSSEVLRCSACHQESFNPKIPSRVGLKAAYHLQCLGCHKKMGRGPSDCIGCHAKKPETHENLVKLPFKPTLADVSKECVRCHESMVTEVANSAHKNTDCLLCHDTTGTIKISPQPNDPKPDLLKVAKQVGRATRGNCSQCHLEDIAQSFASADRSVDIHMGGYDFKCQECHQTRKHKIAGVNKENFNEGRVTCEQCHGKTPHGDGPLDHHLNKHIDHMVCTTCHAPLYGKWKKNIKPEYHWYDGHTNANKPEGDIRDRNSRITPFQVISDKKTLKNLQHEMTPKETALSCVQCHSSLSQSCIQCHSNYSEKRTCNRCHQDNEEYSYKKMAKTLPNFDRFFHKGRESSKTIQSSNYINFQKLGYKGDPIVFGGRLKKLPLGYK